MQLVTTASSLDWSGWLLGLIGAFISGGSGAVGASIGAIVVDPNTFNLHGHGLVDVLEVAGTAFVISAVVSLAKYLQLHPTPTSANTATPEAK